MKKIVVGLLAHVDAGKTTLAEQLLFEAGEIRSLGRVDHKNTFLDTNQMERDRGITIFSKQAVLHYLSMQITLIDTPGHVDFSTEMERALSVMDYAILVINAGSGIQAHTYTLWKLLELHQIPTFFFVNKMDLYQEDIEEVMATISKKLTGNFMSFHKKDRDFYETLALIDENLYQEYLKTGTLQDHQIEELIYQKKITPVFFGSALKGDGISHFLQELFRYTRMPEYEEDFSALVYKITRDENEQRLTHVKITGGILKPKSILSYKIGEITKQEKCDQLRYYSGQQFQNVDVALPGEICEITGLTDSYPGLWYGKHQNRISFQIEPVKSYQLQFPEETDLFAVMASMKKLEEEDPMLKISWIPEKQEIHGQFMGSIQMEIFQKMVLQRFGYHVVIVSGSILYKETIASSGIGIGHYEPLGHYAEVVLYLEPLERNSGILVESIATEEQLPIWFQNSIISSLKETTIPGVLTGSPITDIRITIVGGRAHKKHTEGGDFRQASIRALRQGLKNVQSQVLEPFYSIQLEVPVENVGRAIQDLNLMRAKLEQPVIEQEYGFLKGRVPVASFGDYQMEILSYTKGRGILSLEFSGYDLCENQEEVIHEYAYDADADLNYPTGSIFCEHGTGFFVPWNQVEQYQHCKDLKLPYRNSETRVEVIDCEKVNQLERPKNKTSLDMDQELRDIFERTFGPIKDRKLQNNTIKKIANTEIKEYTRATREETRKPHILLVDGYNIIFAWENLNELAKENLDAARMKLLDILSNYQGFRKNKVIVVFDAYRVKGNPGHVEPYHNIQVVYTKEAETADSYIEKATQLLARDAVVTVATSDYLEQLIILGQGALRMSARELLEEIMDTKKQITETIEQKTESGKVYLKELLKDGFLEEER